MIVSKHDSLSVSTVYVCVSERNSLYLSLTHHRHTVLGYTHFNVQMGRIRVGSHQRFYGFDKTPHRCIYQRRVIAALLGGGEGRMGDGGGGGGRAISIPNPGTPLDPTDLPEQGFMGIYFLSYSHKHKHAHTHG